MWCTKWILIHCKRFLNFRHGDNITKANDIDFAEMDIDEIDELEKKLAELKQQKMKEEKAAVVEKVRKLCIDYKISATQLRGALVTRERKKKDKWYYMESVYLLNIRIVIRNFLSNVKKAISGRQNLIP